MTDDELAIWRRQWESLPEVPMDLIRRVERQTAYMRALRAAEVAVTALIGGGTIVLAILHPLVNAIYWITLAIGTWAFIAMGWMISVRSTRGTWEAAARTTAQYLDLHIRRRRRELDRIRFGSVMGVLLSTFVLVVLFVMLTQLLKSHGVRLDSWVAVQFWIVGGIVNVFVLLGQAGKRRRRQSELAHMVGLQRQLEQGLEGYEPADATGPLPTTIDD